MNTIDKFLENNSRLRGMLDSYLELRLHFQELGFSEKDLEKPPTYTPLMMKLFHKFGDRQKDLFQQVKDYGFNINWNEFTKYMQPILNKIDEITPLSHGNYERGNQGDEDY
jgi:hypothetical protein